MRANYHTHTPRCHHAQGAEREYIEKAIAGGLEILGFSDHAPYFFDGDYYSTFRMGREELQGYCDTVRALKAEYRDKLEIHLGMEMEYYPKHFQETLDFVKAHGVEYLILGQHFIENETDGWYSGRPAAGVNLLERYCSQAIEALQTGMYTYMAHPDIVCPDAEPAEYARQMRRLCRTAKERNIPLEINLLGLREQRYYPNPAFWQVAGEEGVDVVIGIDAHAPDHILCADLEAKALEIVERNHLHLLDTVNLVQI